MPTLDQAIERLYALNVGIVGTDENRHERPHKPLLLLAAFDLIGQGLATPDAIPWCSGLRDLFTERFEIVRTLNDRNTPENPFFHLHNDGFWMVTLNESGAEIPLTRPPLIGESGRISARFTDGFDVLVAIPDNRRRMGEALVSRYFPQHADALLGVRPPRSTTELKVAEDEPEFGRSPAFRRKILEIYDHQCAACGLRIRLPAGNEVSFIDAAHLIPFAESRNDHPTNGLALCKNHHWAMDRNLIAPHPDRHWRISGLLDARRSNGEASLVALDRRSLLIPRDKAFHPDTDALAWRWNRLSSS